MLQNIGYSHVHAIGSAREVIGRECLLLSALLDITAFVVTRRTARMLRGEVYRVP